MFSSYPCVGDNRSNRVENLSLIHTSKLGVGLDRLAPFCYYEAMLKTYIIHLKIRKKGKLVSTPFAVDAHNYQEAVKNARTVARAQKKV